MPSLQVLAAEATDLPFPQAVFDVATASFVLSHLADYRAGLVEIYRVLKPSGTFAMASWTANTDPIGEMWGQLLADAVSKERLQDNLARVTPSESYFQSEENVETALTGAGLSGVEIHTLAWECSVSLELYLTDRGLSTGGRFVRQALGPDGWSRFITNAREKFHRSFGSHLSYSREVIIGLGHKA
jgi:SAM-dependent methyltransferase